jgi:hypothetical protein
MTVRNGESCMGQRRMNAVDDVCPDVVCADVKEQMDQFIRDNRKI